MARYKDKTKDYDARYKDKTKDFDAIREVLKQSKSSVTSTDIAIVLHMPVYTVRIRLYELGKIDKHIVSVGYRGFVWSTVPINCNTDQLYEKLLDLLDYDEYTMIASLPEKLEIGRNLTTILVAELERRGKIERAPSGMGIRLISGVRH